MPRHINQRRTVYLLAALAVAALTGAWVWAGDILRLSQNIPGDSKPIILHANQITTWLEGSRRVFLLKGMVLVEQGVVCARTKQAVAWVDQERTRRTGILHVDVYADGDVALENGAENGRGQKAHLDFSTRGELKLRSHDGKVVQEPRQDDPLYRQAAAQFLGPQAPAPAIQRTSAQQPAPPGTGRTGLGSPTTLPPPTPLPPQGFNAPYYNPGPPAPLPASPYAPPPTSPRSEADRPPGLLPNAVAQAPILPSSPTQPESPPVVQRTAWKVASTGPTAPSTDVQPGQGPAVQPGQGPGPVPGGTTSPGMPIPGPGPPPAAPDQAPPPGLPGGPGSSAVPLPSGPPAGAAPAPPAAAAAPPRNVRLQIVPRTSGGFQPQSFVINNEQVLVVTGGVILTVSNPTAAAPGQGGPGAAVGLLDIEADRVVVWTQGNSQNLFSGLGKPEGHTTRQAEFYLAGNVEIREQNGQENRTLRADEVYYDVARNVAVAYRADLEFKQAGVPEPVHMSADEMYQLSPTQFKVTHSAVFSSRLPSDPGLKIYVTEGTLEEKRIPKKSIFGKQVVDRRTGQPETEPQRLFHGDNVFVELEDVPVFYLPFIQGDANDPLGPLQNARLNYNRIFGFEVGLTFNVWDLIGVDPVPGTRWKLYTDYLSRRGPALGSDFDYGGNNLFDLPGKYVGLVRSYGIHDTGPDILGGTRQDEPHPDWRGRFTWRHYQELPEDFTVQLQGSALSDKNFLEQYFKDEFDRDINQETFLYVKQQRDNWAWTVLTEPRVRRWVTETEWLPRADGYLLGESFLDVFTYDAHADVAYARLRPTNVPPPPFETTDRNDNTGRFDLWQDIALPFTLGPVRFRPYADLDLAYYTEDLEGNGRGRVYGAAGVRASMPLTRLYPDVQNDLLNINAINHKIVFTLNYFNAESDARYSIFPQLDRLNDDATDQALRDIKPIEPQINPTHGLALATSPLYDPQLYALRRLEDNMFDLRVDTLDTVEVFDLDVRQRLQTKRGYPGLQHTVDWMTLDVSASVFPHSNRDNFGEPISFIQYDYTWNVGDRTALVSTGWFDPMGTGARVWTIGAFLNRPDRTSFFLGYRQIEPLQSQAVSAAVTYVFSPKYAMTGSTTYDFGTGQSLSNSLVFTRMGSDLQVNVGFTYNAILNNFGFTFEILPNLAAQVQRMNGTSGVGSGLFGTR